jgi:acetylornithine deacetylase
VNHLSRLEDVRSILARLVAFDTTSSRSNLALIDWVEDYVRPWAAATLRLPSPDGAKANLWVRFGPDRPGGLVMSGHTDVVPVDGQPWTTSPWELVERSGRLYGRGASDMKAFLALCLAHARDLGALSLRSPVHFAFSYDEEVGCAGVAPMIGEMVARGAAPGVVWVGEPTRWGVVSAHKGIKVYEVVITGTDGHSSNPSLGASAIHEAVELMSVLRGIARDLEARPWEASGFNPPYPTLTIGMISGGSASNILARECRFVFDFRATPGTDADASLAPFFEAVDLCRRRLEAFGPGCGVRVTSQADAPGLASEPDSPAERFLRRITGDNARRAVAYATEAGRFQAAGLSSVICGPGDIEQAHQPDEFIEVSQLDAGVTIFQACLRELS